MNSNNNVNRGGPSSTMLIVIGLITICLLSAYATATWPFAMREGYRWDPRDPRKTRR